jgi:hypothetical protein
MLRHGPSTHLVALVFPLSAQVMKILMSDGAEDCFSPQTTWAHGEICISLLPVSLKPNSGPCYTGSEKLLQSLRERTEGDARGRIWAGKASGWIGMTGL